MFRKVLNKQFIERLRAISITNKTQLQTSTGVCNCVYNTIGVLYMKGYLIFCKYFNIDIILHLNSFNPLLGCSFTHYIITLSVFLVEKDDDTQNGCDPQCSLSSDSSADHFNMPNFVLHDDISQDTEQGEQEQVSVESSLTSRNRTWSTNYVLPKFPVDIEEFL